ncbi:siderophore-interacting protein [Vibrio sp. S9_S30]|uniref:siderophore-interacting protein n=1 Tax=Vibrio sp. S9_S30 TaxID=2720226 RepID=UPI001680809D|nr:siderophore-interacting protein [Vibrio sp. S9_S30]MBD1557551.1 siderophore-interacting protein [Vibrio sp. S9_S30]
MAQVLSVKSKSFVTPSMLRITFSGECVQAFSDDFAGAYIKLELTEQGQSHIEKGALGNPILRTYSIRRLDKENNEIDVDFVTHGNCVESGLASYWAQQSEVGERLSVRGPGSVKTIESNADWCFIVADMTGLPAASTILESLDRSMKGYAVFEANTPEDIQKIEAPESVKIQWVIKSGDESLVSVVEKQEWLEGKPGVWCASEFTIMRQLRQYFRNDREVEREAIYISSYWKHGRTEDQHKIDKKKDADQQAK